MFLLIFLSGQLKEKFDLKVDFGDFQFMRIIPKVVRYVSGVATAVLGSGGLWTNCSFSFPFNYSLVLFQILPYLRGKEGFDTPLKISHLCFCCWIVALFCICFKHVPWIYMLCCYTPFTTFPPYSVYASFFRCKFQSSVQKSIILQKLIQLLSFLNLLR